jgi:hypothetical protein
MENSLLKDIIAEVIKRALKKSPPTEGWTSGN